MPNVRLIIDQAQSGSWNMAVDQALLQSANDRSEATLRWYRWTPATLSLGYFQKLGDRQSHEASQYCPVVRRASGGGAIMHDQEWTYSLTLPSQDRWSVQHEELVAKMHAAMISVLSNFGVEAKLYAFPDAKSTAEETAPSKSATANRIEQTPVNSFLCFQRRAINDLIIGENKVCGSAQRRIEGAILQHGSLLMKQSKYAPELKGVQDLIDTEFDFSRESAFFSQLLDQVATQFSFELVDGKLTTNESVLAKQIEIDRFENGNWTERR